MGDLVVSNVLAEKLNETDAGREFLNSWNTFQLYYGLGSLGLSGGEALVKQLRKQGDDLTQTAGNLSRTEKDEVEKIVADVERKVSGAGRVFRVGDEIAGTKVKQVRIGLSGKVVIIGRQMKDHVNKVANALVAEGKHVEVLDDVYLKPLYEDGFEFIIDGKKWTVNSALDDMVKNHEWDIYRDSRGYIKPQYLDKIPMYKLNKIWIEKVKKDGATIIDIGYPAGHDMSISDFYEMEKSTIIWD